MKEAASGWTKPPVVMAILSFLATSGWAAYGLSAKAKEDIESRLRAVEISVAGLSANLNSLTATMFERGTRRDAAIDDLNARMRDQERRR